MPTTNPKFITRFEVSLQDIPEADLKTVFGVLDTLDFEIGETRSVFWYAVRLKEFLETKTVGDKIIDALNRASLTFVDADVIKEMLKFALSARVQVLELQKSNLPKNKSTATADTVYEEALLTILNFSPQEISAFKPGLAQSLISQTPEYTKQLKILSVFYNHVRTVCFILGLDLSIDRYDKDQCFGIVGGVITEFDEAALALSLKELLDYHDGIEFVQRILPTNLLNFTLDQEFSWYESLLRTIILHVTWNVFPLLSEFDQADLLRRLYGLGAWAGVPLEIFAADYVYDTNNVGAYAAAHEFLRKHIEANTENIPGIGTVPAASLKDLLVEWFATITEADILPDSALAFVTKKYPTLFPNQAENLAEALWVYGKIRSALLTESNRAGDIRSEERLVKAALAQLLIWFVDSASWPQIIEYYKKSPAITPKQFFRFLAENFPLENDPDAVDKVMKFSESMAEAGLVPTEFAPIGFSEASQEFIWDEDALFE